MKWLPFVLGAVAGLAVGAIYLTQSNHDDEEWAYAPANAADWHDDDQIFSGSVSPDKQYDTPVLQSELMSTIDRQPSAPDTLFSEEDLAALLEQEQGEMD